MKKGFTLIELLAVIALLATLMVFVVPNALKTLSNSKTSLSSIQKKQLKEAVELYIRDTCIDPIEDTTCTLEAKTATNLITNGGFEDGTTGLTLPTGASVTTTDKYSGNFSSYYSTTYRSLGVNLTINSTNLNVGDVVYFSTKSKVTVLDTTDTYYYYNGLSNGAGYDFVTVSKSSVSNNWEALSNRAIIREDIYTGNFVLYVNAFHKSNGNNLTTNSAYTDDVLLINLTDTFGTGSEPSKEWCNKNLQYPILPKVFYNGELSLMTFANKGYINSKEIENNCTGNINIINNEINLDNITCQF